MTRQLDSFMKSYMMKGTHYVPGRLQSVLALLERLRKEPSLNLADHVAAGGAGLVSHETYGELALDRFKIEPMNKNHGRRSSNLPKWGQPLLAFLAQAGFASAKPAQRTAILDETQAIFAAVLRGLLEQEPLSVRARGRSAKAVILEVLEQADEKGKAGEVAQYLVGAKLMLKFKRDIPIYPANKGDRKSLSDPKPRLGDFEIENGVIEVALGLPDPKHLEQVAQALENPDTEVILLTRTDRTETWQKELKAAEGIDLRRVDVMSVDEFVGRNISELAEFSAKRMVEGLQALFDIYNRRWIDAVGTPGLKIVVA